MGKITIDTPLDMHLHLRDSKMLNLTTKLSSKYFSGALIMPNLIPPITTKEQVVRYKNKIEEISKGDNFIPYMTLFYKNYSKEFLQDIKDNILAIKLYPDGATTNSDGGVGNFDLDYLRDTLDNMSKLNIPLCVHGESNGFVLDREREFLSIYELLAKNFPNLKIIMEHITTKESIELLKKYDNLFATITLHHLFITLDDVAGGLLRPHLFCKPIAKRPEDRDALLEVVLNGYEKVMFGSDSAPHPKDKKEAPGCAAGVFTAPIILPVLVELFEKNNSLDNLEKFISLNAKNIYNINPPKKQITLEKKDFTIPNFYKYENIEIVPFLSNKIIGYKICE